MSRKGKALAAAALMCSFAGAGAVYGAALDELAPISTPPGITLQPLGKYQGYGLDATTAALSGHGEIVYADAHGLTLYTYDQDHPGAIACVAECAKTWRPLIADKNAHPVGAWTVVARPDGERQWALHDKPVYTFVKDEDPGSIGGNSPKRYGRGPNIGERGFRIGKIADDEPMPEGWRAAYHYPAPREEIPPDLDVKEVEDASGLVLVTSANHTVYVHGGDPENDRIACASPCAFRPVTAPQAAVAKGQFAPVDRTDGIRQWTYKGFGLYTYNGDLERGDASGQGVSKDWNVAYVARDFIPRGVTIRRSQRLGFVLANADGRTLYRRDSFILQTGSGHGQRRGVLIRPAVGRDLRTDPHCVEQCDRWHPLLAPAAAQPQAYWDVYVRPDGTKQWAFQGYALWTYDGDSKPGDIRGNDSWQVALSETANLVDIGTPFDATAALYWAAMTP